MALLWHTKPGQLLRMLRLALDREDTWTPCCYDSNFRQKSSVCAAERDAMVMWLAELNTKLGFHPETFVLAASMLDRLLHSAKVQRKYLQCTATAAIYLASKTLEEDDDVPATIDLIHVSECGCSVAELLRMELCILRTLQWNILAVTPLDFLQVYHGLLLVSLPHLSQFVSLQRMTQYVMLCMHNHQLQMWRPATLALALFSLELEQLVNDWSLAVVTLQQLTNIDSAELEQCCQLLQYCLPPGGKRKQPAECEKQEEYYDGIKHLYPEDDSKSSFIVQALA